MDEWKSQNLYIYILLLSTFLSGFVCFSLWITYCFYHFDEVSDCFHCVSLAFNLSCECQILQTFFLHSVLQKIHLFHAFHWNYFSLTCWISYLFVTIFFFFADNLWKNVSIKSMKVKSSSSSSINKIKTLRAVTILQIPGKLKHWAITKTVIEYFFWLLTWAKPEKTYFCCCWF